MARWAEVYLLLCQVLSEAGGHAISNAESSAAGGLIQSRSDQIKYVISPMRLMLTLRYALLVSRSLSSLLAHTAPIFLLVFIDLSRSF